MLRVGWEDGSGNAIDVSGSIDSFRLFAPLHAHPTVFEAAKVSEYRTHVAWSDEIDMAATTLWRLAQEQSGATPSAAEFCRWRERPTHTLGTAAKALGLSRRMVTYCDEGEKPVPRTVALATKALETGVEDKNAR